MTTLNSYDALGSMPFKRLAAITLMISAFLLTSCVSVTTDSETHDRSSEEDQNHSFQVSDNPIIDVEGFNGTVEIVSGPAGEVKVEAKLTVSNRVSYSAKMSGNTVTVVAKKIGSGFTIGRSPAAEIHLVVPAHSTVTASSTNGDVIVSGITGDGELDSSNGSIRLKDSDGQYSATTSNGSIILSNVSGQFNARTTNGIIEFSGSITPSTDNSLTTTNGSVGITFQSDPDVKLDAHTVNGVVHSDRPILVTSTERNHLIGSYGEGSALLKVRTVNGRVDIQ